MKKSIIEVIVIQDVKTLEYFFTTDHCQHTDNENNVPCTHTVRDYFYEDAKESVRKRFYYDGIEIPNPDINYQA